MANQKYRLEELSGQDASLNDARSRATGLLAEYLVGKLTELLDQGELVIQDGVVVPGRRRER